MEEVSSPHQIFNGKHSKLKIRQKLKSFRWRKARRNEGNTKK